VTLFLSIDQTLSTTVIERRIRLARTGEAGAVFLRPVRDLRVWRRLFAARPEISELALAAHQASINDGNRRPNHKLDACATPPV